MRSTRPCQIHLGAQVQPLVHQTISQTISKLQGDAVVVALIDEFQRQMHRPHSRLHLVRAIWLRAPRQIAQLRHAPRKERCDYLIHSDQASWPA